MSVFVLIHFTNNLQLSRKLSKKININANKKSVSFNLFNLPPTTFYFSEKKNHNVFFSVAIRDLNAARGQTLQERKTGLFHNAPDVSYTHLTHV